MASSPVAVAPARPARRPPGSRGHLLWGDTVRFGKDQLGFLEQLKRTFGDVARFRFLFADWVVVSDPELIYEITVSRAASFNKAKINSKIFEFFLGNGVLSSDGEYWKRQHKLMLPGFHRKRIDAYGEVMARYTRELCASWQPGQTRDFRDDMTELTLRIVAKTLFDADVQTDASAFGSAMKVINDVLVEHVHFPVRLPRWVPFERNRRKFRAIDDIERVVLGVVDERRKSGADRGDLLSMLIQARDESGAGMSDKELRDESMTLFFAGHETTAHALTWMWYLLCKHPEVEARVVAELDEVLAGRDPTVADLDRLPYLEQVVKESMRLLPSVWSFVREPTSDVQLGEYRVPAGTCLFISSYLVHRDARWYPDPLRFDPERFTRENERKIPRGAYLPFSMGPRVCLGKQFAMMEARLVLATLLQRLRPALAPGHEPELQAALSLQPRHGLSITVTPRAPARHQPLQESRA